MSTATDMVLAKGMPQNIEAEQFVLGSLLLSGDLYPIVAAELGPADFAIEKHRRIFARISDLAARNEAIEALTLVEELEKHRQLEACDGITYISALTDGMPRLSSIDSYVKIVKDKALLRNLIILCGATMNHALDASQDPTDVISAAETALMRIADRSVSRDYVSFRRILERYPGGIGRFIQPRPETEGLQTPFAGVNEITTGFHAGELIVIAARPGMGKTAFALTLADHCARRKQPVAFFSLEMSPESLTKRLACQRARIDSRRHRAGKLDVDERRRLSAAIGEMVQEPIYYRDDQVPTILQVSATARRIKAEHGLALVIVDYLQLIQPHERFDNRVQEVSFFTRHLKLLAGQLGVPVVALSQLNRQVESRQDKRPLLSDLRESGTIEQDADAVLMLYRGEEYEPQKPELRGKAECIVAKQRNGPTGKLPLRFHAAWTLFEDPVHDERQGGFDYADRD